MNPAYKKILAKKYGHGPEDQHDAQPDNPQYYESTTATPQFSSTNASSPAQNSITHDEGLRNILNQYNATKVVVRPSTDAFPNSKKTHKSTSIPISVVIQPSPMTYGTEEFPTADFGKNNPILRCEECRTYINPFTEFIQGGQRFKCNLCGASNPVPNYYYSHLDANGQREDRYRRPELNYGVYDIRAGNDYMARPPMPPIYFFVIDVSQKGFENGSLDLLSNILNEYVTNDYFWGDVRTKIGFLLYDTNVHLVSLNKKLKQPQIITLTDIENLVRLPIFDNLLVNLSESKDIVTNFVSNLPKMFTHTTDNGSNVFNAVRVSASILRRSGGRMYVLQSNPNVIKESSLAATTKDSKDSKDQKSALHPTSSRFTDLTADMQQNFVSCNLYVFSEGYKNFVTLGELARFLNGEAYYYADGAENNHKFYYDLRSSLSREYTWESVYRVRISSGWKISNKYGNFSIKSSGDLLSLPNCDNSKSLVYEFELEGEVAKHNVFYLQSALLYTTSAGERRIKVTNYGIPLTGDVAEIHANIDAQAIATVLFKKSLDLMYRNPSIVEVKRDILTSARQVFTELSRNKSNPPESMYTFAMTLLGIMKHPLMLDPTWQFNIEADKMNALRIRLNMLSTDELVLYFVPYLFSIHSLTQEDASYYDESGAFVYPQLLNLGMASLSNIGVYLMDAGDAFYMLVGSQTDPSVLYSLFGINSLADATTLTEEMMYQNQEDPLTVKFSNLINELRSRKTEGYAYLHIFKEGDRSPSEMKFYAKLIEDKMNLPHTYNNSYADFVNILSMPVVGNQG